MKKVIVYGSRYGTTQRYAEELAEKTGIPAVSYKNAPDFTDCETLIYLGGLYAGGIRGLSQTIKRLPAESELILITVGLADPTVRSNVEAIAESAKKQLPAELFSRTKLYHLRGGIDYKRLSIAHRLMMKMKYALDKKLPPEQQTAESREMVATYGQKADFVNLGGLTEIIETIYAADII